MILNQSYFVIKKSLLVPVILTWILLPNYTKAEVAQVMVSGFSTHLQLAGATIFNPGIGAGIDFRKKTAEPGLSFFTEGGWIKDCANYDFFILGGGIRHHWSLGHQFFTGGSLGVFLANGAKWDIWDLFKDNKPSRSRNFSVFPTPRYELGAKVTENAAALLGISYIPKWTLEITSLSTHLLFFTGTILFNL